MPDFASQWIEIFRAGDYGPKGNWDRAKLARVVKNFEDGIWTAPAVFGHPEEDSPAHGWVQALKLDGDLLKAQFKQVTPDLEAKAREGRFPNRSAAFYRDPKGSGPVLRHVGFLGATPPEVKGLEPIQFSDGDFLTIEFTEDGTMDRANAALSHGDEEIFDSFAERWRRGIASVARPVTSAVDGSRFNESPFTPPPKKSKAESSKTPVDEFSIRLKNKASEIYTTAEFVRSPMSYGRALAAARLVLRAEALGEAQAREGEDRWAKMNFTEGSVELRDRALELQQEDPKLSFGEALRQLREEDRLAGISFAEGTVELRDRARELQQRNPSLSFGEALRQARFA
jgi:hypothetical protein